MKFFLFAFGVVGVSLAGGVSQSQIEAVPAVDLREKRMEIFVEDAEIKLIPRQTEDDWFVLFDLPDRGSSFMQTGITNIFFPFMYSFFLTCYLI